ncbi:hypothetical protein [Kutzneria sp. 744]|uniref:hypothetical protein n=1 Tax=Kutzneria sp. (strain 744) TaxID=345341 RepID=UPI0012F84609|nr:hypothetical protein [Kutzneria sp. 744]
MIASNGIAVRSLPPTSDTVVDPLYLGADEEALAGRRNAPIRRPGRRLALVSLGRTTLCLVTVIAFAAGCGASSTATPTGSAQLPATSTSVQDTSSTIEHAYVDFWTISNKFVHDDPAAWSSELAAVAVEPQLTRMLNNLDILRSQNVAVYGETREYVTKVDVDGAAATVTECQDASGSGQADARTGEKKTIGIARNPVTSHMQRGGDGKWRVSEIAYPGGTC